MGSPFIYIGIGVFFAIVMIVVLVCEQKDKKYRARNGLPPRRYHDVTDYDSTELHLMNIEHYLRTKK